MNRKEFVDNKIENNIKIRDNKIDDELRIGFDSEKKENTENKKNKISGIAYNIVRVIAFAVAGIAFGYASYELMDSYLDYTAAQEKYSAVDEMFNQIQSTEQTADTTDTAQTASSAEYQGTITKWVWDYDAMLKYNDESKGYIKLDGTRIQYPIYVGHRHYIYHVFSSFRTKADNEDIYKFGFKDDDEFAKWIKKTYDKSNFKYDSKMPGVSDKILICSTCVDNNGNRMVVCMYRGEEVVD